MALSFVDDLMLVDGISLYVDEPERARHIGQIVSIAQGQGESVTRVTACYERVLAEIKPGARILNYLDIIVARKVVKLLGRRRR